MDSKQIWVVVLVAIVASAITTVATLQITGNTVKVPTSISANQIDVYTKAEVDRLLLSSPATIAKVLNSTAKKGYIKNSYIDGAGAIFTADGLDYNPGITRSISINGNYPEGIYLTSASKGVVSNSTKIDSGKIGVSSNKKGLSLSGESISFRSSSNEWVVCTPDFVKYTLNCNKGYGSD